MKDSEMAIPHLFRCPISLDLFKDPVTLCTGQTYDRSSIEKWLSAGNLTCPVTMQKLHDPSIVPNHTLRHLIDEWLQSGHQIDPPECSHMVDPVLSLSSLKQTLQSHDSTLESKLQILEKIQFLTQEWPSQNYCLIQSGFFPLLLDLAFKRSGDNSAYFIEQTIDCALKLMPFSDLGSLNMLQEESSFASFLSLFEEHGNTNIMKALCRLVEAISSTTETKQLCATLGKNTTFLQGMVQLIQENSAASEAGIKAMTALCSLEPNRENLVQEGAIHALMAHILGAERCERSLAPAAMAALELLLGIDSAREVVITSSRPSGVKAIVKMVFRVSDLEGSESAVNLLLILCCNSMEAREEAIGAGILTQLLLLLQSQCSGRTKTKARLLLKLLTSMWSEGLTRQV